MVPLESRTVIYSFGGQGCSGQFHLPGCPFGTLDRQCHCSEHPCPLKGVVGCLSRMIGCRFADNSELEEIANATEDNTLVALRRIFIEWITRLKLEIKHKI